MNSIENRLKKVFCETLDMPYESAFEDLAYGVSEKWDSMAHMLLVSQINSEFGITLGTEEIISMSSFCKTRDILEGIIK